MTKKLEDEYIYTIQIMAHLIGVPERNIYTLMNNLELAPIKIGRTRYFNIIDFNKIRIQKLKNDDKLSNYHITDDVDYNQIINEQIEPISNFILYHIQLLPNGNYGVEYKESFDAEPIISIKTLSEIKQIIKQL